jgi:hypothetical protein
MGGRTLRDVELVIIACPQPSDLDLSNDGLAREGARGS